MSSKHRNQLSEKQIKILRVIIKCRFITVELLGKLIRKSKSTVYERLVVLEDQGYIHKRYEKSWKKLGQPAVYSLTGKGLRCVRDAMPGHYTDAVIRNQYKNKSASLQLIHHSLEATKIALMLAAQYKEYTIVSKPQLDRFKDLIRPLPDFFIESNLEYEDGKRIRYQLDFIEAGTLSWLLKKRMNAHEKWYDEVTDSGIHNSDTKEYEFWWEDNNYPILLFVCQNKSTEKRIHRLVDGIFSDFDTLTTTQERLETGEKEIWLEYWDDIEMEYRSL